MRRRLAVGAVVLALLLAGVYVLQSRQPTGIAKAEKIAAADNRWETTREASDALAEITDVLFDVADHCDTEEPRCSAIYEAIGFTQVGAVFVLKCTQPGVFEMRQQIRPYLAQLSAALDGHGNLPTGPRIPTC